MNREKILGNVIEIVYDTIAITWMVFYRIQTWSCVDIDSKVKEGEACVTFFGFIWEDDLSQRKSKETVNIRS